MDSREGRRFRPILDGALEGRVLLSRAHPGAEVRLVDQAPVPGLPRLSRSTAADVYSRIDRAFADYRGKTRAADVGRSILEAGTDFLGSLLSGDTANDSAPMTRDSSGASKEGDLSLLLRRVGDAVAKLPNGRRALSARISAKFDPWEVTPENARYFQDWVKAEVHRYVKSGARDRRFVLTDD